MGFVVNSTTFGAAVAVGIVTEMASHDQTKAVICGALAGIAVRSGWYSLGSAAHAIGQLDPFHDGAGFFGRIGLMIKHSGTAIATGAIAVGAGLAIPYVVAKK